MFTEKDYKDISRDVYLIDEKHGSHDPNLKEGAIRKIDGKYYKVLKVEDNTTNGMQAMAVAPIIDGKADTSEVAIAYAGTNPKDTLDIMTDAQTVVLGSKVLIPESQQLDLDKHWELDELGIPKSIDYVEGQVMTAETFANDVQKEFPDANITTTGHSLGEYIALYIAAENGWKNVGFNGPDPSNILSEEAKQWIEENPGMLINYSNVNDKIGNVNGDDTNSRIYVDMDMGKNILDTLDFHNLSTWKFDEDGNLFIEDTYENKEARLVREEKVYHQKMNELTLMLIGFLGTTGSLSSTERIFLNNARALVTAEYVSQSMEIGLEYIIKLYEGAISEAEEAWENGVKMAEAIGVDLTYGEILNALQAGGATKYSVVFEPASFYRDKISKAVEIRMEFEALVAEIKESLDKLLEKDEELAAQIS